MSFVYLVFILILLLLLYVFTQTIRFHLLLHLDEEFDLNIFCLYPLLKVCVKLEENKPILSVYVFRIKVYKITLKMKRRTGNGLNLIQSIGPKNIHIDTYYGFRNPCTTGLICGAFSAVSAFLDIDRLHQEPDFLSSNDYVYVEAKADIRVGQSIINLVRKKSKRY